MYGDLCVEPYFPPFNGNGDISLCGIHSMMQVQDVLEAAKVLEWLKENCTIEYVRQGA